MSQTHLAFGTFGAVARGYPPQFRAWLKWRTAEMQYAASLATLCSAVVRGSGLLRRCERGGVLVVGFKIFIFESDASHAGGIGALRMGGDPVLR
jgi:hypothetical protein